MISNSRHCVSLKELYEELGRERQALSQPVPSFLEGGEEPYILETIPNLVGSPLPFAIERRDESFHWYVVTIDMSDISGNVEMQNCAAMLLLKRNSEKSLIYHFSVRNGKLRFESNKKCDCTLEMRKILAGYFEFINGIKNFFNQDGFSELLTEINRDCC
ncbi:MAG: hypothetical protein OHK0046_11120 [Anaerolineae bacterium]